MFQKQFRKKSFYAYFGRILRYSIFRKRIIFMVKKIFRGVESVDVIFFKSMGYLWFRIDFRFWRYEDKLYSIFTLARITTVRAPHQIHSYGQNVYAPDFRFEFNWDNILA